MREYQGIPIPNELLGRIDKAIQGLGYVSRSDFVRQSIRNELLKISVLKENKHDLLWFFRI